jgi:hypothetical protein
MIHHSSVSVSLTDMLTQDRGQVDSIWDGHQHRPLILSA